MSSKTGEPDAEEQEQKEPSHKSGVAWWKRLTNHLKDHIAVHIGLAVVAAVVLLIIYAALHLEIGKIAHLLPSADRKRKVVLCVFPKSGVVNPILDALGFKGDLDTIALIDGVDMKLLVEDPTPAETLKHVQDQLDDENVVLLIAHERSSTMNYMNENLYEKEPFPAKQGPIPIILLAVTNPSITEGQEKSDGSTHTDRRHILRLPATDRIQADLLRQVLRGQENGDLTLLVDTTNPTYSKYLAAQMVATDTSQIGLPVANSFGVNISGEGFSPSRFLQKETRLLFIGMEVEGTVLLRSLKSNGVNLNVAVDKDGVHLAPHSILVTFTDGVAGAVFDGARKVILDEKDVVFLTGPFVPEKQKGLYLDSFPDYRPHAMAAKELARRLLGEAGHLGGVTRMNVLSALQQRLGSGDQERVGGIDVQFDEKGDNLKGQAHLFEITRQGVRHSLACTCSF